MAEVNKLTDTKVKAISKVGLHLDGSSLYLKVAPKSESALKSPRSWVFRYQANKKIYQLGLGKAGDGGLSLKKARELASKLNEAKADGADIEALREIVRPKPDTSPMTFKVYAEALIAEKQGNPRYRSKKALNQWTSTLTQYVYPKLGEKRPGEITVNDVHDVLKPLWAKIPETATRLRQRIEAVIDHAAAAEDDDRPNPAAWGGRLRQMLKPAPKQVTHHAAAAYRDVPTIMAALRTKDSTSAMCLRFSILTAARSGEARGALWSEIDLDHAEWRLPRERMKASKDGHIVYLCDEAVEILKAMKAKAEAKLGDGETLKGMIFAGPQGGLISDVAINKTLHGIIAGVTAHGFRSSFRDWGAEVGKFSREALELSLAHTIGDKVEAAYNRAKFQDERRSIMKSWGKYCSDAIPVS